MIFERLNLENFRSFRGYQSIDLTPNRSNLECPIILFGGLNGAGKTTILLAIKLVLFGRQALGHGTTVRNYQKFLKSCIHQPSQPFGHIDSAAVSLNVCNSILGREHKYEICRKWISDGKKIHESLSICKDGIDQHNLSPQECQGFLYELFPVGISELFFFDGEKISELAFDQSGYLFKASIRKLLGLDGVERLRNDLRVYTLRKKETFQNDNNLEIIQSLTKEHKSLEKHINNQLTLRDKLKSRIENLQSRKDRIESRLIEIGGEWGSNRKELQNNARGVRSEIEQIQKSLRNHLSGIYPLSSAKYLLVEIFNTARINKNREFDRGVNEFLDNFRLSLEHNLFHILTPEAISHISDEIQSHYRRVENSEDKLELTQQDIERIDTALNLTLPVEINRVDSIMHNLIELDSELSLITERIQLAPEQQALAAELNQLASINNQILEIGRKLISSEEELKLNYRKAIKVARKLDKAYKHHNENQQVQRQMDYATRIRSLLKEYEIKCTERKKSQLESVFLETFERLSRKKNFIHDVKFNSRTLSTTLFATDCSILDRSQLSAGEKQIYAISMLETLAKVSEYRLPVVIDTPLGKLDSQHRRNLAKYYFPNASRQVLLLSTDSEVDQEFYSALSPYINREYKIEFNDSEGASTVDEGYFWPTSKLEAL